MQCETSKGIYEETCWRIRRLCEVGHENERTRRHPTQHTRQAQLATAEWTLKNTESPSLENVCVRYVPRCVISESCFCGHGIKRNWKPLKIYNLAHYFFIVRDFAKMHYFLMYFEKIIKLFFFVSNISQHFWRDFLLSIGFLFCARWDWLSTHL